METKKEYLTPFNAVNSLESTSLEGVKQNTILGAIDLKQQCSGCNLQITGGTERGTSERPLHDSSANGHWYGFKLDFGLDKKLNNFIESNFTPIGARASDDAPGYKDNLGNGFWREGGKQSHWDSKLNHNYQYKNYSLEL